MRYCSWTLLLVSVLTGFAGTSVLFAPSDPSTGPFPSDTLTISDPLQKTGIRIDMPVPSCDTQYTACQEGGLLDQMDGFSIRARMRVRFSGPINPATLAGGLVYVALDNLSQDEPGVHQVGQMIPVDQVIYDPATNTAYAKPFSALDQHRRYAVLVTDSVLDTSGAPVTASSAYQACLADSSAYCQALARAISVVPLSAQHIAAASVFTTMSATGWLERARAILPYVPPVVMLAQPQSTFRVADIAGITLHEQTGTNPPAFEDLSLPVNSTILGGLDRLVIGSFESPLFLAADLSIPPSPTNPGLAVPDARVQVGFNALLPSTPKPPNGYPVVVFGHGFGDSRFGGPTAAAPTLARAGLATIAIDAVGHGFGPLSSVTFTDAQGNSTTVNAMGRGVDVNGDGTIESNEGCALTTPIAYGTRDCFRQTVVDLMQLIRAIRQGIDLDGDGKPDLDGSQIYYAGDSLGANYGTMLVAVEPAVRASALIVGGASTVDIARWSPAYRSLSVQVLSQRSPSLLNQGAAYNEDYVLPGNPPHVTTVPGAIAIQNVFENLEWLGMPGDPMAYAPHLKLSPLPGVAPGPVLVQFARGDMTVTNPGNSGLIRAAGLQSHSWEYRHDVARKLDPTLPADPHPFFELFVSLGGSGIQLPGLNGLAISLDAQGQVAGFFASGGATVPDPNVLSALLFGTKLFQVPGVLPFDFGF
ncbi:MAG TPA: Ig-like domain-containing protein [Candidatus Limnocylindrales bacterium]|nr:Ig-like domain-containing protein [Candidatus Limnocylindrales bacterium]